MFRRRPAPGLGIVLLAFQLLQVGFNRVPPVTLAIIGLNTAIYLRLFNGLPSVSQACISFYHVWYNEDWKRIFLSPFFHLDDMHLFFNMSSLLWKGMTLESRLGSGGMFYMVSAFSILTSLMLIALDKCFSVALDNPLYLQTCAAGFSGVIFALKVVTTYHLPPGLLHVMGFRVPSRVACWVELILIQLLTPRVSFTGHLAGILVGFLYVKGPLKELMAYFGSLFGGYAVRPSYTYNFGRSGRHTQQFAADEDDEELQAAIRESLRESRQTQNTGGSSGRTRNTRQSSRQTHRPRENLEESFGLEEIRRRRLLRFQN